MIRDAHGDLLSADVDALVNTVNTVGVMGKGIALQFKKRFPGNFKAYAAACKAGDVETGRMFVFDAGQLVRPRWIINFPTKRHWKSNSRIEDIDAGRLRANLGAKAAEADIAVETYNATLLRALREVADEVRSLAAIEAQQREQEAALAAAEAAFDLATQRYRAGLGNFLVVLTAEGNVLVQRRGAADLKARHLLAEVNLARALGGGVTVDAPPPRAVARTAYEIPIPPTR